MKLSFLATTLSATVLTSASFADFGADIGVLTCKLKDVHNDIVYTSEAFACEFKPKSGDAQEYTGEIKSLGVDLSVTKDMTLVWAVLAPTAELGLAGGAGYVGGSADVALGAGAGANVLVGGGHNSVTLQPLSASGIIGSGVSVGIEEFELR